MFGLVLGLCLVLSKSGSADPTTINFPKCVSDCAVTGLQKLYYVPGFTYSYSYKGESQALVEGVKGATTNLQWEVEVHLHWTSPCDVVLELKNPFLNGIKDKEFFELTKFPVMFSMSEGTVQGICFHPLEEPHNVNFKKGIIASLQNTLPSLSVIHSDKTYKEVDTLGSCPTHYTIKSENAKFIISKFKNHFDCSEYKIKLPKALKVSNLFRNSVFSPSSSSSNCDQEIENGILDSVKCEDSKVYSPTLSTTKYLSFKQFSYLKFQQKSVMNFPLISNETEYKVTHLPFEKITFPHSPKYVPILTDMLEDLCRKITEDSENSLPNLVNNLVKLLEKIPTKKFVKLYEKIKAKKICPQSPHFRYIFMDLLAYVDHEVAIKIMVDEIVSGKLTGFRKELYGTSLLSFKIISAKSIEYLLPLFRNPKVSSYVLLIVGNMIHKYCNTNSDCFSNPSLNEIFTILSKFLRKSCSDTNFLNDEKRYELLLILKAMGNIGYISYNLEVEIFRCVSSKGLTSLLRVTAIQSLRLTSCTNESKNKFLNITLDEEEGTELRVESFLQTVRCLNSKDIELLNEKLMKDTNSEVRSFIVSFINNTLKSQFPLLSNLKDYYKDIILKIDEKTMTSSRNIDKGYFFKSLGLGFDSKSNLILDERENLKKYENSLYLSYLSEVERVFQISTRIKNNLPFNFIENEENINLETIDLSKLELYGKTVLLNLIKSNNEKLFSKRNFNSEGQKKHGWDAFVRFFDTELFFFSLHYSKRDLLKANLKSLNNEILKSLRKVINNMRWNDINSVRVLHNDLEIFMPTVQGIPAVIKWDGSVLFGLGVKKYLPKTISKYEVSPKFNSQFRFFIGYHFGSKVGVRSKININLSPEVLLKVRKTENNKITLHVKTNESKINILIVRSEIYLFRKLLSNHFDEKIFSKFHLDSKSAITNSCIPPKVIDSRAGTRLCWDINSSNIHKNKIFPFGTLSTVNFYMELDQKPTEAIELSSTFEYKVGHAFLNFELEGLTSEVQKLARIDFNASTSPSYKSLVIFTQSKENTSPFGLKYVISNKENQQGSKNWVYLYSTSKTDGVFSSRDKLFSMNYEVPSPNATTRPNIDFKLKTLNNLADIVNINIKVLADVRCKTYEESFQMHQRIKESFKQMIHEFNNDSSYLFMRVPLEKTFGNHLKGPLKHFTDSDAIFSIPFDFIPHEIEIQIGSGDLQTKSSLKTLTYEKKVSQYKFSTKLEGGKSLGGAKVEGFVAFKGLLDGNLQVTSKFNGKFGNSNEYQTDAFVEHHTEGTIVDMKAQNLSKNKLLALFKYSRTELPSTDVKEEGEIAVDGYIPYYKVEGTIVENYIGVYEVLYLITENGIPLLHVEGPISIFISDDKNQEVMDLTINSFSKGKYQISGGYTLSGSIFRARIDIRSPNKEIVWVKLFINHPNTNIAQVQYNMKILDVLKVDFETENTVEKFTTNIVLHILPNSSKERQLTGYSQLNYEKKQFQAKFTSENKAKTARVESILVDSTYEASTEDRYYHVRGNLKLPSESFPYNLELNLGSPKEKSTFKRVLIEIGKPDKNYLLELLYRDNVFKTNIGDVTTLLRVKGNSKGTFELGSNFCYSLEQDTQIAGQVNMSLPDIDPIVIKIDFMSILPKLGFKLIEVEGYALNTEQNNKLFFNPVHNQNSNFEKMLIQGMDFKFRTEALLPNENLSNLTLSIVKNSRENQFLFQLYKNRNKLIFIHSEFINNGQLLLNLFTFSKNIKISSKLLTKESSLTLYPNKEWSTSNYSLGGRYSKGSDHIYEDDSIRKSIEGYKTLNAFNGKVNYLAQVAIPQTTLTGVTDLYLNSEEYERVSFSIESIKLSKGSYKTEVIFRSRFFESDPRILLESTFTSNVKSLTLSYQREASVSPSLSISATYNSILKDQTTFYSFVKINETEIELISTFDADNSMYIPFYKDGFTFNGSLRTSNDLYGLYSAHCHPGYLEVGYQKQTKGVDFVTKFGFQEDLILVGIGQRHQQPRGLPQVCLKRSEFDAKVAMASVSLVSETFLQAQSFYNVTEIATFLSETNEISKKLNTEFKNILKNIWQEIFLQILNEESKHFTKDLQDIFKDTAHKLTKIYKGLRIEKWLPDTSKWIENLKISHNFILRHFDEMLRHLKSHFIDSFEEVLKEVSSNLDQVNVALRSILRKIIHYTENGLHLIQTRLRNWNVFQTISNFLRSSNLWKLFEKRWDFFVEHFKVEFGVIQELISRSSSVMAEEFKHIWNTLVSSSSKVQGYLKGFVNWAYAKEPLKDVVKKFFTLSVDHEGGSLQLEAPLRSPAHSLRTAFDKIGFPNNLTKEYFRIPFVNFNVWHEIILRSKNK